MRKSITKKMLVNTLMIAVIFLSGCNTGKTTNTTLSQSKAVVVKNTDNIEDVAEIFNNKDGYANYQLSTDDGTRMDVPYIFSLEGDLYAIYHVTNAGYNHEYDSMILAKSTTNKISGPWHYIREVSARGSMAYIKKDPYSSGYFMFYELERHSGGGNMIAVRYYSTAQDVINNTFKNELQLSNCVRVAASPNGITDKCQKVNNIGTPSIEDFDDDHEHLNFKFHYAMGMDDVPGTGNVLISRDIDGVYENYLHWEGKFSNDINNSLRTAGAKGKIGMRDSFEYKGNKYYLYEAQLSDDPNTESTKRWASWRIFLYNPKDNKSIVLSKLDPTGNTDLANPRIYINGDELYLSVFIPSENGISKAGPAVFGKFTIK